jgi:hypothetical protein
VAASPDPTVLSAEDARILTVLFASAAEGRLDLAALVDKSRPPALDPRLLATAWSTITHRIEQGLVTDATIRTIEALQSLDPSFEGAELCLGLAHLCRGDRSSARRHFEKQLSNPSAELREIARSYLESLTGDRP